MGLEITPGLEIAVVGLIGTLLALCLLMYLAYRGITVLVLAPILALLACALHDDVPLLASYTQIFMPALGGYLLKYFPVFMLGAIFGKIMAESGAATAIGRWLAGLLGPRHAITAVVCACALLTYGGVSLFVVAFAIFPIAVSLFQAADIPKRLIPGAIALGSFTFTMTALPGTPAIQNTIPMPYFGTDAFAAPGLGLIASAVMLLVGLWWLQSRARRAAAAGEGYGASKGAEGLKSEPAASLPPVWLALAPLITVVVLNYLMSRVFLDGLDASYLSEPRYGATSLEKVKGLWALIAAMAISTALLIAVMWRWLKAPRAALNQGTLDSLLPILNTASEVGFGKTIAALGSFALIKEAVVGIAPGSPLISEAISVNLLAGLTGSASGGLSIALEALGSTYVELARQIDLAPDLLHRVATLACGGLDTLPHNGAVVTLLAICGLTHRKSYLDIFMVAVAGPFAATVLVVVLGGAFGSF